MTNRLNDVFSSLDLWESSLEKYAKATHLTVKLFDGDGVLLIDPIHPTPLFQLFEENGYDPGIFAECARRCLEQSENRPPVIVFEFGGLAVTGTSLALEGEIAGAAVAGYVFVDFSQISEVQTIARNSGIPFERLWRIAREQKPVPQSRLITQGELLQALGDALLKANLRTRQHEQNAENLESIVVQRTTSLRKLSSNLLRAQDDKRRKLARELHDSIGQYLAHAKMGLAALKRNNAIQNDAQQYLDLMDTLDRCLTETRTISYLLHPPLLDEIGFASAAQWYADGFSQRSGIKVNLNMPRGLKRLPSVMELVLFRVLQEGLTNVHRHAHSSSVDVELRSNSEEVRLEIVDHGKGISSEFLRRFKQSGEGVGVGLSSMRERVSELGGKFEIQSDSTGTVIRVVIPSSVPMKQSAIAGGNSSAY